MTSHNEQDDKRRFRGVGELERTGYIPAGSAAEREVQAEGNVNKGKAMTKDDVLKARGTQYDAALRTAKAAQKVQELSAQLNGARNEYNEAAAALERADKAAAKLEQDAIALEVRGVGDAEQSMLGMERVQ